MHLGRMLWVGAEDTLEVFTPWMSRVADQAVFTYETIYATAGANFSVRIYHKSSDDKSGTGTLHAGTFSQVSGTDFYTLQADGLLDMLRFKITLSGTDAAVAGVLYRFLETTWFNQARV